MLKLHVFLQSWNFPLLQLIWIWESEDEEEGEEILPLISDNEAAC